MNGVDDRREEDRHDELDAVLAQDLGGTPHPDMPP
jgi:hypothetical protein